MVRWGPCFALGGMVSPAAAPLELRHGGRTTWPSIAVWARLLACGDRGRSRRARPLGLIDDAALTATGRGWDLAARQLGRGRPSLRSSTASTSGLVVGRLASWPAPRPPGAVLELGTPVIGRVAAARVARSSRRSRSGSSSRTRGPRRRARRGRSRPVRPSKGLALYIESNCSAAGGELDLRRRTLRLDDALSRHGPAAPGPAAPRRWRRVDFDAVVRRPALHDRRLERSGRAREPGDPGRDPVARAVSRARAAHAWSCSSRRVRRGARRPLWGGAPGAPPRIALLAGPYARSGCLADGVSGLMGSARRPAAAGWTNVGAQTLDPTRWSAEPGPHTGANGPARTRARNARPRRVEGEALLQRRLAERVGAWLRAPRYEGRRARREPARTRRRSLEQLDERRRAHLGQVPRHSRALPRREFGFIRRHVRHGRSLERSGCPGALDRRRSRPWVCRPETHLVRPR